MSLANNHKGNKLNCTVCVQLRNPCKKTATAFLFLWFTGLLYTIILVELLESRCPYMHGIPSKKTGSPSSVCLQIYKLKLILDEKLSTWECLLVSLGYIRVDLWKKKTQTYLLFRGSTAHGKFCRNLIAHFAVRKTHAIKNCTIKISKCRSYLLFTMCTCMHTT